MKSYLCEDAESVMELSFTCGSYVWNCARHLKHLLVANVVRWDWSMFTLQQPLELTWTSGLGKMSTSTTHLCWKDVTHWVAEIWVLVESLVFCVGAVVPQRFIAIPGFTFCELSSIILIFSLTMQISCPRRDRWNIFGRQEVESLQARLENRRLNRCNMFQIGQNLDHVQSRRLDKKVFFIE